MATKTIKAKKPKDVSVSDEPRDVSESPKNVSDASWTKLRSAMEDVVREMAPAGQTSGAGADPDGLRRMVTEAVSAVLLQGDLLNKLVTRIFHTAAKADDDPLGEAVRKICLATLREFSMQTFGPVLKNQLQELIKTKLLEFGSTEEFKTILDSRFRVMEQYLRSDVIPQTVKRTLKSG